MATPPHRFEALDSWRGICALMVALLHFEAFSHLKDLPFFNDAYLFVDFFFVLSGFVIAANYQERLANGFGLAKFMVLRFGRLYPLYLVILLAFFLLELTHGGDAFSRSDRSIGSFFANVFLLQSFGTFQALNWNAPGWSIATEFWTCLLFAIACNLWPKKLTIIAFAVAAFSLGLIVMFSKFGMNVTYDYGMSRCIAGFSIGVLTFAIWRKLSVLQFDERLAFVLEVACVLCVVLFVAIAKQDQISIVAPLAFAIVVLVFAAERGPISKLLRLSPFQFLGALSYSIYIVHLLVETVLVDSVKHLSTSYDLGLVSQFLRGTEVVDMLGRTQIQGDIWVLVLLSLVVAVSAATYRFIEVPSRRWFRGLAQTERP
jgi:peptidoglycan/LPS O-acetylase OafA/YrhL